MRRFAIAWVVLAACHAPATATAPPGSQSLQCLNGQIACGPACTDTHSDPQHCGDCLTVCPRGLDCVDSSCTCPLGRIACGTSCVDPLTDHQYCGASNDCQDSNAGTACADDQLCDAGVCHCDPSTPLVCDGACIDPSKSVEHCGAAGDCQGDQAGTVCGVGQSCGGGTCVCIGAGDVRCGEDCIDPSVNTAHCGARDDCTGANAGTMCAQGASCVRGNCVCPHGLIACGSACVDPTASDAYCGAHDDCQSSAAGVACSDGLACMGGVCGPKAALLLLLEVGDAVLAPAFTPAVFSYRGSLAGGSPDVVTVAAVPVDPTATILVNGVPVPPGQGATVRVAASGTTTIEVQVLLPDGLSSTYTVTILQPVQVLQPDVLSPGDDFGESLSFSGGILVVGVPFARNVSGAVYVFASEGGKLVLQSRFSATVPGEGFGHAVSVSEAGNLIAVGAPLSAGGGAVYLFAKTDTGWVGQGHVQAPAAGSNAAFGSSVAIRGGLLAVSAPGSNRNGQNGEAYLFEQGSWLQTARVSLCSLPTCSMGAALALSRDAFVLGGTDGRSGLLWVYLGTAPFHLDNSLLGQMDTDHPETTAGTSLSISGTTLVTGDPVYMTPGTATPSSSAGWLHVFTLDDTSATHVQDLTEPALTANDQLGANVSVDGDYFAAGAAGVAGVTGRTYVYHHTTDGWHSFAALQSPWSSANMGQSVALSAGVLAVGAPRAPVAGAPSPTGAVLIYQLP